MITSMTFNTCPFRQKEQKVFKNTEELREVFNIQWGWNYYSEYGRMCGILWATTDSAEYYS